MQAQPLTGLNILVLDDETLLRKQISAHLERLGADVTQAANIAAARSFAKELNFDYCLLDVNLPDGTGTDLLKEKVFSTGAGVIVMTGNGAVGGAVEAMKLGALDYLMKPFDPAELPLVMLRARKAKQSARVDEHRKKDNFPQEFFFGDAMAGLKSQIQKILDADRRIQGFLPPILIIGETGTGKTTIARMIHNAGPRAAQQLVEVNCSALPDTLAESELFGHERGAFTDAHALRMGLFEAANNGSLFLDELPSLSIGCQAKVLTAIEDRRIRRVGGTKEIPVDSRIIAATNRDLKQAVTSGSFREDLYHRLDLFRLTIPPLRTRGADILRLAESLMESLCKRYRIAPKQITSAGQRRLMTYHWPGNVRELSHELERAIIFEDSPELEFDHLLTTQSAPTHPNPASASLPPTSAPWGGGNESPAGNSWLNERYQFPDSGFSLEEAINQMIQKALNQAKGNVSGAARLLGVTRDYVRYRLEGPKGVKSGGESRPE